MSPELVQVVFWLLVTTVVVLAYDMHQSLKPTYCERCAHCAALRDLEREKEAAAREPFNHRQSQRSVTWHERDDDSDKH